jgi:hypothetical protein
MLFLVVFLGRVITFPYISLLAVVGILHFNYH